MKQYGVMVFFLFFPRLIYAQVGINTDNPRCTLDIVSGATDVDGILIPKLTREQLTVKGDEVHKVTHDGMMVFISNVAGGDALSQRVNIDEAGFYYFDGLSNVWEKVNMNPWRIVGGTKQATNVDQNIYQNANVAIGSYSTTVPSEKLDIDGNMRIRNMEDGKVRTDYPYNIVAKADGTLGSSRGSYDIWRKASNNAQAVMSDDDTILNIFSQNVTVITLPSNPKPGRVVKIRIDGATTGTYTVATPTVTPVGYLPTNYTVANQVLGVTAPDYITTIKAKTAIELVWTGAYGSGGGLGWVQIGGDNQVTTP